MVSSQASAFDRLPQPLYFGLAGLFDLVSLLTLAVICLAVARRLFFPPSYIEARSRDAFVILGLIAGLMVAFFLTHAGEIALGEVTGSVRLMPISNVLAGLLGGMSTPALHALTVGAWWAHAVMLLAFLNYLPYSKHMHILTAIPNCFLRRLGKSERAAPRRIRAGPGVRREPRGSVHLEGFVRLLLLHRMRTLPGCLPGDEHRQAAQPAAGGA